MNMVMVIKDVLDSCVLCIYLSPSSLGRNPCYGTILHDYGDHKSLIGMNVFLLWFLLVLLQELEDRRNAVPSADIELMDSFHKDPGDVPEKASTASTSESLSSALVVDVSIPLSGQKMYSTLEFRFQDLLTKRRQMMSRVLYTGYRFKSMKKKRSMK